MIPVASFSISTLAAHFPAFAAVAPMTPGMGIGGPLRTTRRSSLHVSASLEYHEHEKDEHYWVLLRAVTLSGKKVDRTLPTVEQFESALGKATNGSLVSCAVAGRHQFPKRQWEGVLTLPVPLPFGELDAQAELTGVQVTYHGPRGRETVLLSTRDDALFASTDFTLTVAPTAGLFVDAVERSFEVAKRNLNEVQEGHAE